LSLTRPHRKEEGFLQIPGKVVGGAAPADCLAGTGCVGDARMAAPAIENNPGIYFEQVFNEVARARALA
jgi:hypothetical protein